MLSILGKVFSTVFGIGGDQTVVNSAGGVVVHAVAIPAMYYFVHHYNESIPLTVPMWNLAVLLGVVWLVVEYVRRRVIGGA